MTELQPFEVDEVRKVNSEKNSVQSFLKAPKQNPNAAYFPPILFLMIINILITTIKLFFLFYLCYYKTKFLKKSRTNIRKKQMHYFFSFCT